MRFEESIEIDAPQQRVWEVLSDVQAWPGRIETVSAVKVLTPAPLAKGSRVFLAQPKLPDSTWDVTVWEPPSFFEWRQKSGGVTNVAGHRVDRLEGERSRLTLSLEIRGLPIPLVGLFYRGLITRYLSLETQGMRLAAESNET